MVSNSVKWMTKVINLLMWNYSYFIWVNSEYKFVEYQVWIWSLREGAINTFRWGAVPILHHSILILINHIQTPPKFLKIFFRAPINIVFWSKNTFENYFFCKYSSYLWWPPLNLKKCCGPPLNQIKFRETPPNIHEIVAYPS